LDFSQLGWASNRPVSKGNLTKRGPLKKTLTFKSQIWYQREWLHNREEFLPGKFLSVRNPVNKKNNREKERTHSNVFTDEI
jgi:hypothetical protein